ncbi:MAG TPA: hypothetical protein VJX94_11305 [Stellaceae bacterium]|nr:hypothetical protein [Stellaceae bacterium]
MAPASFLPILEPQPRHAFEFLRVVGDKDHVARHGLTGDQNVIGSIGVPLAAGRVQSRLQK